MNRTFKVFMLLKASSSLNADSSRNYHDERYVVEISIHESGVLESSTDSVYVSVQLVRGYKF